MYCDWPPREAAYRLGGLKVPAQWLMYCDE
jgi:hypothetical protein